jgi:(S)-2-hydroxyglutarate dehydrogenase
MKSDVSSLNCDVLIVGAGVIGLAVGRELSEQYPGLKIVFLDKEDEIAFHGSGRNSGVLHAGFYYTANSLKAKFTRDGNLALHNFCDEKGIKVNRVGKVVVAQTEDDVAGIRELERRAKVNGVKVSVIDPKELGEIDPNAKTKNIALWSPTTSTVDPKEVCAALKHDLEAANTRFLFGEGFAESLDRTHVRTTKDRKIEYKLLINTAGLYADRIAQRWGCSAHYRILPFKGVYLKFKGSTPPVRTNIYPVPNLGNPFLGVHFTITVDGDVKIGPTAIPALWRENYSGLSRFKITEFAEIMTDEARLFLSNAFGFRKLAFEELRKYKRDHFVRLATRMVRTIDASGFSEWSKPGIRAQLLDLRNDSLVQDFVVESTDNSVHILNAVSPAFTGSIPFAQWIVKNYCSDRIL